MALFSKKKNTEVKALSAQGPSRAQDFSWVLIKPRITEKSTDVSAVRAYVFNVAPRAGKRQIAQAIKAAYKVTPVKIRVVPVRAKSIQNARTGIKGMKPGGKKAYVYLKEGDTISVI